MNGTLSKVLIFAAGAAIGSVATWTILKKQYEDRVQEEVESVRESLSLLKTANDEHQDEEKGEPVMYEPKVVPKKSSLADYKAQLDMYKAAIPVEETVITGEPYVIPPEDFGEADYNLVSYTYYADGVLADDMDNPVTDIEGTVGKDSLTRFGEFEEDSVFVRNDALKNDYEILLDERKYADIYTIDPGTEDNG